MAECLVFKPHLVHARAVLMHFILASNITNNIAVILGREMCIFNTEDKTGINHQPTENNVHWFAAFES